MAGVLCAALLLLCGAILVNNQRQKQSLQPQQTQPSTQKPHREVEHEGQQYVRNFDLETVLVLGLDKYHVSSPQQFGYLNDQQADLQLLLILDHSAQTCQMLHLNRDTMTEIQRLGVSGDQAGTFEGQLALAHTYGSGGSDSCLNATKAVSKLLHNVPVQHYLSLTMDAVAKINDAVGGVPVEIKDDFSAVDPALRQGETVRLQGEQALTFVRARGSMEDSSNLARMERQRQYITALYGEVRRKEAEDPNFFARVLLDLKGSFQSDYSINQLEQLVDRVNSYEFGQIYTIPGEAVQGEEFMEFYVDEDALQELVLELFYQPAEPEE